MSERNYRDAVHNIIRVDTATAEGELIARLIDTREFQRLRRIRQLGLAYFAYQTAEHSRFTHSLGAFHLAGRLLDRLSSRYEVSPEDRIATLAAALLHDVGHGPFSHVIESILGFHHEEFTIQTIQSRETAIGETLRGFSASLANDIAAIIRGDFRRTALAQMVSSQLDVDRMDYLLRDSLMTGVKYGIYDLEWVLKSIEIDEGRDQIYVTAPGIYSVEDYLQARYYMFRQVYFHRTLRAAEVVLRSLIKRALELFEQGKDIWFARDSAIERVLAGKKLSLAEHLSLDDADLIFHIKHWRLSNDPILSDLSSRFLDRRLFKAIEVDLTDEKLGTLISSARNAASEAGFDPDHYIAEDVAADDPYFFYAGDTGRPKDLIYVESQQPVTGIREISEVSAAVRGLQRSHSIFRICFPGEIRRQVEQLLAGNKVI